MINSLRSELVKLRRPTATIGYVGAAVTISTLMTIVSFINADNPNARGPGPTRNINIDELGEPGGSLAGFQAASSFLGIIGLAMFATAIATEFSTGTIRAVLVTDPRRRRVLAGKVSGLALFLVVALTIAAIAAALVATLLSGPQGIDTSAWPTAEGIGEATSIWARTIIATIAWGLFGAMLAMYSRSASLAIAAGVAYFLIGEHLILQSLWPSVADWLPAGAFAALASGGSATLSFASSLSLTALYGGIAYLLTSLMFERRDVTD